MHQHQKEKIIVFASNCEVVNFLTQLISNLNWERFGIRDDGDFTKAESDVKEDILCSGHIYKLHGDMDHNERKKNYFGFDKAAHAILICTDVASRGLDFKNVEWIVQYDPSSNIKEYVNRVGRTARIAHSGKSITLLMPHELEYLTFLAEHKCTNVRRLDRFEILKKFQVSIKVKRPEIRFTVLKNIEDVDEKQEAIHKMRAFIRLVMER